MLEQTAAGQATAGEVRPEDEVITLCECGVPRDQVCACNWSREALAEVTHDELRGES